MIISMINHYLMWKMQKPLSTVVSRWKSRARERNSSTFAQLREAGEITNATWFLVLKYMTVHDCTIIPSSVPIVVANQQISVFQVKPASPSCWKGKTLIASYELMVKKTGSVSHHIFLIQVGTELFQLFQLPRLHRIIGPLGSGHSFHFWLNEDP